MFIINYFGEHGSGMVGQDDNPVNSIDFALSFKTKKEAKEKKEELKKTWTGSNLEVCELKTRTQNYGVICDRNHYLVNVYGTRKEAEEAAEPITDPGCINDTFTVVRGIKNISSITGLTVKQIENRA